MKNYTCKFTFFYWEDKMFTIIYRAYMWFLWHLENSILYSALTVRIESAI